MDVTSVIQENNLGIKGIFMTRMMITSEDGKIKFETDSFPCLYILPTLSLKRKPFLLHPLLFTHFQKHSHLFPFSFPPALHISPGRSYVSHLWTGEWMIASLPQPSVSEGSTSVWHASEVASSEWQNESAQVERETLRKSLGPWSSLALFTPILKSIGFGILSIFISKRSQK